MRPHEATLPVVDGWSSSRLSFTATLLGSLAVAVTAPAFERTTPIGRFGAAGYLDGSAIIRTDPDSPRQRPDLLLDLNLTYDPTPKVRAFLDTHTLIGGTPERASGFDVFNLRDTFQNISPSLDIEEGYLDVTLPDAAVRFGKQKFSWGRLDRFPPTDVVNPRRYFDPFLTDEQDAKIGIPAVSASYYPPAWSAVQNAALTFIWVPLAFPVYFPSPDERWFPPAVEVTGNLFVPKGSLAGGLPVHDVTVVNGFEVQNRRPPRQLDQGAFGLRAAGTTRGVDFSLTYYDGVETQPNFDFTTAVRCGSASLASCSVDKVTRLLGQGVLLPRFDRIRQVGADAAFQLGGFTARWEGAYGHARRLARPIGDLLAPDALAAAIDPATLLRLATGLPQGKAIPIDLGPLMVSRDVVQWGIGVDTVHRGWMPLLQITQTFVLHNDVRLLVSDVDTRIMLVLRKGLLDSTLLLEAVGLYGIERGYSLALLRATYAITDDLRIRAGYLSIAGTRVSLIGQYHDNDEAFVELRYSF